MVEVAIRTEYIELGQFLKLVDCIASGGEAKFFLQGDKVAINGEIEHRRGKKLYDGDRVDVDGRGSFRIKRASGTV